MRWIVGVLGLFALVGCTASATTATAPTQVLTPTHPTGRVVLYIHGAGGDVRELTADPLKRGIVRALLAHGFTIASATAEPNGWGDRQSVRDYRSLLADVARHGPVTDVYILAQSMGGLAGLRLTDLPHLRAWAGIYPVCDLASVYRLGTYADQIRTAYGPALPAALLVRPHFDRAVPVILWSSPQDTVVPKVSNADACAAAARKAGGSVREISTTGEHGDPSNFNARQVVRFFDQASDTA